MTSSQLKFAFVIVLVATATAGTLAWMYEQRIGLAYERSQISSERTALAQERAAAAEQRAQRAENAQSSAQQALTQLSTQQRTQESARNAEAQRSHAIIAARLQEGLAAASQVKAAMVEAWQTNNEWPKNNRDAGLPSPLDYRHERVHSLIVRPSGQIRVILLNNGQPAESLVLRASVNRAGIVSWQCSSPDLAQIEQFVPACHHQGEGS